MTNETSTPCTCQGCQAVRKAFPTLSEKEIDYVSYAAARLHQNLLDDLYSNAFLLLEILADKDRMSVLIKAISFRLDHAIGRVVEKLHEEEKKHHDS